MTSWSDHPRSDEVIFRKLSCRFEKSLNSFLHSIGKHPGGCCHVCLVSDDDKHFLFKCKRYASERDHLEQRLAEKNQDLSLKTLLALWMEPRHL